MLTAMLTRRVPWDAQGELRGGILAVPSAALLLGTVCFACLFGHFMAEGRV